MIVKAAEELGRITASEFRREKKRRRQKKRVIGAAVLLGGLGLTAIGAKKVLNDAVRASFKSELQKISAAVPLVAKVVFSTLPGVAAGIGTGMAIEAGAKKVKKEQEGAARDLLESMHLQEGVSPTLAKAKAQEGMEDLHKAKQTDLLATLRRQQRKNIPLTSRMRGMAREYSLVLAPSKRDPKVKRWQRRY